MCTPPLSLQQRAYRRSYTSLCGANILLYRTGKGDLWVVSSSTAFLRQGAHFVFLAESVYHGISQDGLLRIEPLGSLPHSVQNASRIDNAGRVSNSRYTKKGGAKFMRTLAEDCWALKGPYVPTLLCELKLLRSLSQSQIPVLRSLLNDEPLSDTDKTRLYVDANGVIDVTGASLAQEFIDRYHLNKDQAR
jgi:hypothetical protein